MFCSNCGKQVNDNDNVCPYCGAALHDNPGYQQPGPMNNGGYNQYNQQYQYNNQPAESRTNGFAIAGFVLSFFFWLLGLIFSVIGLNKSKIMNDSGRGLAIAGIVISIISGVIMILVTIIQYSVLLTMV